MGMDEADEADVQLGADGPAHGSGEVVIEAVHLLNANRRQSREFDSGEPMLIEIEYQVRSSIARLACSLGITRSDGLREADHISRADSTDVRCPPVGTTSVIRYAIDSLPLANGAYALGVSLHDPESERIYDRRERGETFRVSDRQGRDGLIDLAGRWLVVEPAIKPATTFAERALPRA
jgi:hypothetical protein